MPTPPPDPPATRTAPMAPWQRRQAFTARRMGRDELVAEVGRGGMGVVSRARDPELGRDVALKVLEPGPFPDDDAWTRFLREARAAARLQHPGIVRVYDIGEHEGCAYFTMPLVEGPTLAARLRQGLIHRDV